MEQEENEFVVESGYNGQWLLEFVREMSAQSEFFSEMQLGVIYPVIIVVYNLFEYFFLVVFDKRNFEYFVGCFEDIGLNGIWFSCALLFFL